MGCSMVFPRLWRLSLHCFIAFSFSFAQVAAGTPSAPSPGSPKAPAKALPGDFKVPVQVIKTPQGFSFWAVKSSHTPVVSGSFAFKGAGSCSETKAGLASFLAGMLGEGAGNLSAKEYKRFCLEKNIQLAVSVSADDLVFSFSVIKDSLKDVFHLIKLMIHSPRFEAAEMTKVRTQLLEGTKQSLKNEHTLLRELCKKDLFASHPYGAPLAKVLEDLPTITASDFKDFLAKNLGKDNWVGAISGDFAPEELKKLIDETFKELPAANTSPKIEKCEFKNGKSLSFQHFDIPQSLIAFMAPGISPQDPDYIPACLLLSIVGEDFNSRLFTEIREKRGLVYYIMAGLGSLEHLHLLKGITASNTDVAPETLRLIQQEWEKLRHHNVTQKELDFVKKKNIGSFPLSFANTGQIVAILLGAQLQKRSPSYINEYTARVKAVTLEDIDRVRKRIFMPQLVFAVIGREDLSKKSPSSIPAKPAVKKGASHG